ncbi:RNA polymerase sigma factor, partial [Singulisphaera rosea]
TAGLVLTGLFAVGVARLTPASAADKPDAGNQAETKAAGDQAIPRPDPKPKASSSRRSSKRQDPYSESQTEAILDSLDRPVSAQFPNETPLEEFVKYVKVQTRTSTMPKGIPIYVDPLGLQEAEKTMASTITIDLESIPLRVCVGLALKQLGLEYRVRDGVMIIGSADSENAATPILELQTKAEQGDLTPEETRELTTMLETRISIQKLLLELHRLENEEQRMMNAPAGGGSHQ